MIIAGKTRETIDITKSREFTVNIVDSKNYTVNTEDAQNTPVEKSGWNHYIDRFMTVH